VLGMLMQRQGWGGEIYGARPKRPPGRPFRTYAVSCVWGMTLSRVGGSAGVFMRRGFGSGRSCGGRPSSAARAAIGGHPRGLAVGDAAARLRGVVGRGPPQTGRAGGLLRLTRCLAIGDDAIAFGGGEIIFFGRLAGTASRLSLKMCQHRDVFAVEGMPAPRLTCRRRYASTAAHCPKTYPRQSPLPLNTCPHQDCLWSAREARHAQHDTHRADHHRPSP